MILPNRSIVLLSACLLAGCGDAPTDGSNASATPASLDADERIACALGGSRDFAPVCTVERVMTDAGLSLIVRQPGGGFHRLLVTGDGRGVIAADGAEAARVAVIDGGQIEVAIGSDRYRLPATVKPRP